jgi:hypothetical protein
LPGQNNMNLFIFDHQLIQTNPQESLHRIRLLQKTRTKKNDHSLNCKKETENRKKNEIERYVCV